MDELKSHVQRLIDAGVPEPEIGAFIQRHTGTVSAPGQQDLVDTETGAPSLVRAWVGKETSPERKKLILSRLYGEVRDLGDGNMAYRDPKSGKLIQVNPSGFDVGDVAGSARELTQAGVGLAAAPATLTGVGALGSAAAAAGAGQAFDYAADAIGNLYLTSHGKEPIPYKRATEAAKETALETGGGYAGGAILGKAAQGVGRFISPLKQEVVDAWARLGARPPTVGTASDSRAWHIIESALNDMVTSSGQMGKGKEAIQRTLQGALEGVADSASPGGLTAETLGSALKDRAIAGREAWKAAARKSEESIYNLIGNNPAGLKNTVNFIESEASKLSPSAGGALRDSLYSALGSALEDARSGALNTNTLKALRTGLNERIGKTAMATTDSVGDGQLKALRATLARDISDSITNPAAKKLYDDYMSNYAREKGARDALNALLFGRSAEKTTKTVGESLVKKGVASQNIGLIGETLGPEATAEITSTAIRQLGKKASTGDDFISPQSVITQWTSYTPEVRQRFLGALSDDARSKFEDVLTISDQLRKSGQFYNTSKTGGVFEAMRLLRSPVQWAQGGLASMAPVSSLASPYLASRIATSPAVIGLMSSPVYRSSVDFATQAVAPQAGRLGGLLTARSAEANSARQQR